MSEPGWSRRDSELGWSRRDARVFAASLLALALVPWTVRYWPSQDGPNHLAVARVIAGYGEPGSPFPPYFSLQHGFRPSAALDEVFALAGRFMRLQTVEKGLASAAILLLPLSVLLLVRRAVPHRTRNVFLTLPFVLGWPLGIGFLSFELGMALGVLAVALGWEPASGAPWPGKAWRIALASLVYFLSVWCHPAAALITGLVFLLLEWENLLRWRQWPRQLAVVGPAATFVIASYVAADVSSLSLVAAPQTTFLDPVSLIGALFEYNIAFTPLELAPRIAALALLLPGAYRALRDQPPQRSGREAAVGRVVAALLAIYFVAPTTLTDWFYCSARFLVYGLLLLPAAAELRPAVARRLVVVGPALAALALAVQWPVMRRVSARTQDIVDVGPALPRGAKLIPIDFNVSVLGPQLNGDSWGELVVTRDALVSQLFAVGRPRMGGERFRTLLFRPGVLDVQSGALPWSDFEMWTEVARACAPPGSPVRWFVHVEGECGDLLAIRKRNLEKVVDRYDDVLMLDPPDYAQTLLPEKLRLVRRVGSAWLYAVGDPKVR